MMNHHARDARQTGNAPEDEAANIEELAMTIRKRRFLQLVALSVWPAMWVSAQWQTGEIRIVEQYPPAEVKLQEERFVAVYRKPHPYPAADDQWVVVRDRKWGEVYRAIPGKDFPNTFSFTLMGAALSKGGLLAISGNAWSERGESAEVIGIYDLRQKTLSRIVRTSPVLCVGIEFDPAGDLWCVGSDVDARRSGLMTYDLVYRYAPDGKQLSRGISRSSISSARAPETDKAKGDCRVFFSPTGETVVWVPAVDTAVVAGRDAREIRRWQPAKYGSEVTYTFAATGNGRLFALLPPASENGIRDSRYRLHELVGSVGQNERGRAAMSGASDIAQTTWQLVGGASGRHFAGRSTELVGMDGQRPVIWDRSAGRIEWLDPID